MEEWSQAREAACSRFNCLLARMISSTNQHTSPQIRRGIYPYACMHSTVEQESQNVD